MEEVVGGPGRGRSEAVVVLGTGVATGRGGRRRRQWGEEGGDGKRRTAAAAMTGRGRRRAGVCEEKEAGLGIGPAGSSTAQL